MKFGLSAMATGLLLCARLSPGAAVTVHSDGVTGDYATIGAALAAVQTESPGPGTPDVITILNDGPFREGALLITGDAHANNILVHAADGVRPILVSSSTGANAIEIRKNGRAEIRDLVIIPASNISQTATRAILYHPPATGATGYSYHLQNIVISSNNGKDKPVSGLDGLGSPLFNPQLHKSFRGDGGIRGNSTDEDNVYRMTMRNVVVSCITSAAPFGLRSFQDGADGSELVIGEGCVFSRIISTTSDGAAINLGGMEGSPNIGRIQGTPDNPVLVVNNGVAGLYMTGTNAESNTISNTIISGNARDGIFIVNARMSTQLMNVTIVNNGSHAIRMAQNDGTALNFEGTLTATDSIIAGNGAVAFTNSILGTLAASGSLVFQDSAIVRFGAYRLNPALANGMSVSGSGSVVMDRIISTDPRFVTLGTLSPDFATVTAPDYVTAATGGEPLRGGGKYGQATSVEGFSWYHYN